MTAIIALTVAILGLALALYAIFWGMAIAARRKTTLDPPLEDGTYRLRKVGTNGVDVLYEIEEVKQEE